MIGIAQFYSFHKAAFLYAATFSIHFSYSPNTTVYGRKTAVEKHPGFYYDFTIIDVLNLHCFAEFCLFCDKFNNLTGKIYNKRTAANLGKYKLFRRIWFMIKVLFACNGSILKSPEKACKIKTLITPFRFGLEF